jgi:hypothetical protein
MELSSGPGILDQISTACGGHRNFMSLQKIHRIIKICPHFSRGGTVGKRSGKASEKKQNITT